MQISPATSTEDFAAFASLVTKYVDWCRTRFAGNQELIDEVFGIQALDAELRELPAKYTAPEGRAFLARDGETIHGCIAYRRRGPEICEMKRLFVPQSSQGKGIGKSLGLQLIDESRNDGFQLMRLDTSRTFTEAIALYRSLGFCECAPYYDYPAHIMADALFMDRRL